jgi:transcriptional regulator with XRE-family HTH domain
VDPAFLAEVELRGYAASRVSLALMELREEAGLRQEDIQGLSERHVRRLEKEEGRLTVDAAKHYAATLGLELSEFLRLLSRKISELRDQRPDRMAGVR